MPDAPALEIVTALPALPPRAPDGHKGSYGHVLVLAGSRGMTGAAVLCGGGALRGGAGLVTVATPDEGQPTVAAGNPGFLTLPLPADDQGRLAPAAEPVAGAPPAKCAVPACGPAVGRGP